MRFKRSYVFILPKIFVKEVYREDKIKEWDPVDPSELENFLQIIIDQGRGCLRWSETRPGLKIANHSRSDRAKLDPNRLLKAQTDIIWNEIFADISQSDADDDGERMNI